MLSFDTLVVCSLILCVHRLDSFVNVFTRSEVSLFKERCGHSVLLNNNYWLLNQTQQALKAIQNHRFSLDILPWKRLSMAVQQIHNACLVDDSKYSKERSDIHQATLKAGNLLATKVKALSQPTWFEISKK